MTPLLVDGSCNEEGQGVEHPETPQPRLIWEGHISFGRGYGRILIEQNGSRTFQNRKTIRSEWQPAPWDATCTNYRASLGTVETIMMMLAHERLAQLET